MRADRTVRVLAPLALDLETIRRFVRARGAWIERKLAEQRHQPADVSTLPATGALLPFLGESLQLVLTPGRGAASRTADNRLIVPTQSPEQGLRKLKQWYRSETLRHASISARVWVERLGRSPRGFVVREQKTRWGSCSSEGVVSLNWRLLLGSPDLFEYVLVHELCHLRHHHHGPRFWAEVAALLPDYMDRRARLRRFPGTWF